jgi:uncharacterized protein YfaS (alpha-2-macroglobulin family)
MANTSPSPHFTLIRQGDTLLLEVLVVDGGDEAEPVMEPSGGLALTLYIPDGTRALDTAPMTPVGDGRYRYTYPLASDAPAGVWDGETVARHGGRAFTSDRVRVCRVEA